MHRLFFFLHTPVSSGTSKFHIILHSEFFFLPSHLFINFPLCITEIRCSILDKFLMPLPAVIHNITLFPTFLGILWIFRLKRLQPVFSHCSSSYKKKKKSTLQLIGSSSRIFKKECKMVKLAFNKSSRHLFNYFSKLHSPALPN